MPAPTTEQRQRVDAAFKPFQNFHVWNTGGNCAAWRHDLDDDGQNEKHPMFALANQVLKEAGL